MVTTSVCRSPQLPARQPSAYDVIGSLYTLQFLIYTAFVLVFVFVAIILLLDFMMLHSRHQNCIYFTVVLTGWPPLKQCSRDRLSPLIKPHLLLTAMKQRTPETLGMILAFPPPDIVPENITRTNGIRQTTR